MNREEEKERAKKANKRKESTTKFYGLVIIIT